MPFSARAPTRAKIIATLGPGTDPPGMVRKLIEAGASIFRLNFSHGTLADHERRLEAVRAAGTELDVPVAVLGDLCGPKIRVGPVPGAGVDLHAGQTVIFTAGSTEPAEIRNGEVSLPTTYLALAREVQAGHRVLINDGAIRLLAVETAGDVLRCVTRIGGVVSSGKGINLPDSEISAPAITERDWECVQWAVQRDLDFLALSFVRRAEEVRELKQRLEGMCPVERIRDERGSGLGACIPVIAKIEKPQAVAQIDAIADAADAIMVARGDLGVEMDLSHVPVVQKRLVARCADWGKPCVVATQMLESMIQAPIPTRAEASDVANAVFDGVDALMLSGETAVGRHPDLVVETMRLIISAAEARIAELPMADSAPQKLVESRYRTAALAHGAWYVARDIGARLVVCWSESGGTARYLSQNNFHVPIIAYSSSPRATRRMALLGGVTPIRADPPPEGRLSDWTDAVERLLLDRGWAREGDPVVLVAGKPLGAPKATNSLAVLHVGDPRSGYRGHAS